jgi:hypothetical protein
MSSAKCEGMCGRPVSDPGKWCLECFFDDDSSVFYPDRIKPGCPYCNNTRFSVVTNGRRGIYVECDSRNCPWHHTPSDAGIIALAVAEYQANRIPASRKP